MDSEIFKNKEYANFVVSSFAKTELLYIKCRKNAGKSRKKKQKR